MLEQQLSDRDKKLVRIGLATGGILGLLTGVALTTLAWMLLLR